MRSFRLSSIYVDILKCPLSRKLLVHFGFRRGFVETSGDLYCFKILSKCLLYICLKMTHM